jgi:hypothetical protein
MRRIGLPVFRKVGARGAEAKYDGETDRRILALLDSPPPKGYANWSGPRIVNPRNAEAIASRSLRARTNAVLY